LAALVRQKLRLPWRIASKHITAHRTGLGEPVSQQNIDFAPCLIDGRSAAQGPRFHSGLPPDLTAMNPWVREWQTLFRRLNARLLNRAQQQVTSRRVKDLQ
jgi:hypothetical protein